MRPTAAVWSNVGLPLLPAVADCYTCEPVFVAAPGAQLEDDGVILSVVLDGMRGTSFLLVLDVATFIEIGRAEVPHHVPFGFHGQYFRVSLPTTTG